MAGGIGSSSSGGFCSAMPTSSNRASVRWAACSCTQSATGLAVRCGRVLPTAIAMRVTKLLFLSGLLLRWTVPRSTLTRQGV